MGSAGLAQESKLILLAAGSLRHAFAQIFETFKRETGASIQCQHGPAGLLRQQIEQGVAFDAYVSANMAHPEALYQAGLSGRPMCFASNSLCLIARADLSLNQNNFLEIMLEPSISLGTSTQGDDPAGDYAQAAFALIDQAYPGRGEMIANKALQLVGGRNSPAIPAGRHAIDWMISQGKADLFVAYGSTGHLLKSNPSYTILPLPSALTPKVEYGLVLAPDAKNLAQQFADYLLGKTAQRVLQNHGFSPVKVD